MPLSLSQLRLAFYCDELRGGSIDPQSREATELFANYVSYLQSIGLVTETVARFATLTDER